MVGEGPLRTRRKEARKKWVAVKREEERTRASTQFLPKINDCC